MGLFSKKECSICGGDAGRVFTKKLEDGVLCKECTGKLSPWFSDRRSSTVSEIQEQLDYREANKEKVAAFHVTRTLNGGYKILIDEDAGLFMVVSSDSWKDDNPDVMSLADITGCTYEIVENKIDVTPEPGEGEDGPQGGPGGPGPGDHGGPGGPGHGGPDHGPGGPGHGGPDHGPGGPGGPDHGPGGPGGPGHGGPRPEADGRIYEYDYDFQMTINVNNPYFSEIEYRVNESDIEEKDGTEYASCAKLCEEIKTALTQARESARSASAAAAAPKQAINCPHCGATTTPTAAGCCEYCGSAIN